MTQRIRHCLSCPHCCTRYLVGFSPYSNGSYLVCTALGSCAEYVLYCSCNRSSRPSRWKDSEIRTCEVSSSAYRRGYGSAEEITLFQDQELETPELWRTIRRAWSYGQMK